MPDTRDPGAAVKRLRDRLAEEALKAHPSLIMRGFSFDPDMEDGPNIVRAVFSFEGVLDDEPQDPAAVEQARIDAEFEQMLHDERKADEVDKMAKARKDLEALTESDGLGLDDDVD